MRLSGMSRCAAQLWEIIMATINYVGFDNFEVDCSEITGDENEILEIMQQSHISIQNLCDAKFGYNLDDVEERDELIRYLNEVSGNSVDLNSQSIRNWIARCEEFEILLDLMTAVTVNLYRVIRSRGQL